MKGKRWLFPVVLLLLFLAPGPARAADIRFQSSTQYLWYTDPFKDQDQSDIVEYLKIGAPAIDNSGRFSAFGYGRVSKQFGGDVDPLLGDDEDVLGRLYFLYVNYALPADRGDIRLGRQFVAVGAGAGTVDGVRVDVRKLGPVTVSAFAGYDVRFAETTDRSETGNYLVGASAGGSFFKGNNIEISYLRKYDSDDVIREMAGVHADQRLLGIAKAYADLRYDVLHETYSEFLAGVKLFPFPRLLTITGEYFASYPNFDADTIYTVFAVTRYWEALGRVDYRVGDQVTLYGSYTRADYDGPTADVGTLGVRTHPTKVPGLGINASVDVRSGYPGDLTGFRISAEYAYRKALVAAGVTYDVFQRDSMADDFSAKKYWAGGSYECRKNLTAKLRVEDTVTRQFENEFQGRASVDLRF
jgi:hypothetical protein